MAPFRPTNINKRAYPGNASVIGPGIAATVGISTSVSTSTFGPVCGTCVCLQGAICLGCRYFGGCACPCCCEVCTCNVTCFDRTVPSGIWKSSEVYTARLENTWGGDTSSTDAPVCVNKTCVGITDCSGSITDCKGYFICCGPTTEKWFVAPESTEVTRDFYGRVDAVTCADTQMGACGWFVPCIGQLQNPGFTCRTYWDTYCTNNCD